MLFLLPALVGCVGGPYAAPYGSELIMPEDENLTQDAGYAQPDDGIGGLIHTSIGVLVPKIAIPETRELVPGNNIRVDVTSGWGGAYLIPEEAVRIIGDYATECEGQEDNEDSPCHAWFDNESEEYIEFGGEYTEIGGGYKPTYMMGATDNRGFMDIYIFVDSVPTDSDGNPIAIPIFVSIEVDIQSFNIDYSSTGD